MEQTPAELLKSILNTAERHPNAKVSKLIKCFEEEKTPQNIALLLIELAEHPEFSADISISLKYYLDCFNKLREEPSFAEAGIVLYNSSKIYAKRVDHIHNEIERLILSLGNVENTSEQNNPSSEATQTTSKVKRGKKRTLEQINGAVEANMSPKRFKKLLRNKRFDNGSPKHNNFMKPLPQDSDKSMKNYIPQSTWQHSSIEDFDYEDEIDSKKNYKLFTYHLEHRYNTLIPDINFKMYFKIKDYINGDCNDCDLPESWPPLSDAYIEQFLDLEDAILLREGHLGKTRERSKETPTNKNNASNCNDSQSVMESGIQLDLHSTASVTDSLTQINASQNESRHLLDSQMSVCESFTSGKSIDSGIGSEISGISQINESQLGPLNATQPQIASETSITNIQAQNSEELSVEVLQVAKIIDSSISEKSTPSEVNQSNANPQSEKNPPDVSSQTEENQSNVSPQSEKDPPDESAKAGNVSLQTEQIQQQQNGWDSTDSTNLNQNDPTLLDPTKPSEEDLSKLKIILPHLPDEGIFFTDLDEKDRRMLSPTVVTQDVFGCLKDKSNIVIKVDDAIEKLFKVKEPSVEKLLLPLHERQNFSIRFNILKIPLKYLNKQRRFKLCKDFDLLKKDRLKKYIKRSSVINLLMDTKSVRNVQEIERPEHISPPSSPSYEPDWLGFPEESLTDKNRTMSRDSGISLHPTDKETIEEFAESPDLLSSTIKASSSKEGTPESTDKDIPAETKTDNPPVGTEKTSKDGSAEATQNMVPPATQTDNPIGSQPTSETTKEPDPPSSSPQNEQSPNSSEKTIINSINFEDNTISQLEEMNEENRVRKKVHEWHSHLQPILACSRERHHFDVFALGTEIMTQFDKPDLPIDKVSFQNVMEEKEESLISRYFLSMLLLANQGNILIDVQNKNTSQPSELHDIRLKLLNRKRNVVSLEDNIGLRTTPTSTKQVEQKSVHAVVRTLKSVSEVPRAEDCDSGVAMSETMTTIA